MQMQDNRGSVRIYNLVTIGAETMIYSDSVNVTAKNNLEVEFHPYWSQIAMFDPVTNTSSLCTGTPSSTNAPVPSGSFVEVVGDTDQDASSWFVLVNGTPLDFVLDSEVQANMVEWNFSATVPAGKNIHAPWPSLPAAALSTIFPTHSASFTVLLCHNKYLTDAFLSQANPCSTRSSLIMILATRPRLTAMPPSVSALQTKHSQWCVLSIAVPRTTRLALSTTQLVPSTCPKEGPSTSASRFPVHKQMDAACSGC